MSIKKKPFVNLLQEVRELEKNEVIDQLSEATDMNNGIRCPVVGCSCKTVFKRWGDMRGHFLDNTTHKKDFFRIYMEKTNEPFCDLRGAGFNHGVNSLMLALIRQPTSVEEFTNEGNKKTSAKNTEPAATTKSKKARPILEQQILGYTVQEPIEAPPEATVTLFKQVQEEAQTRTTSNRSSFSRVSEMIRESDEINKVWRGKVLEEYVDMFHGIPPCFHCRSEEGKQIHHQNPLFHEIVLISLNKLGTTAERVIEEREKGDEGPLKAVLQDVFAYHMKPGRVCAVPYCQGCNQDAEIKRRKGRRNAE
jgi:hypothetical protein